MLFENIHMNLCTNVIIINLIFTSNIITTSVLGLKCICNPQECDVIRSQDCPGKGMIVWDPCKCCKVCAKTFGEACGGPGGFSGKCENSLYCISKPPISGSGICLDLPKNSTIHKCENQIVLDAGCEIMNRKCKCWGRTNSCKGSIRIKFDFKNIKECKLNLQNLNELEAEFDEDYTLSPTSIVNQRIHGER